MLTSCEELELADNEAAEIASALRGLQDYYGDSNLVIPEWVIVWGVLFIALGKIYGPRAIAIRNRIAKENTEKGEPAKVTVIDGNAFAAAGSA